MRQVDSTRLFRSSEAITVVVVEYHLEVMWLMRWRTFRTVPLTQRNRSHKAVSAGRKAVSWHRGWGK